MRYHTYILGLARVSRCLARRDEEHNTKAFFSKMDPTTGVHVVGLRLYSALLTEKILSCLQGKRIQIGAGKSKTSASSFNVVSHFNEKPVSMESGFCPGPLLLSCLTFSTIVENYADFYWKFGTKLDSTTSFVKKPSNSFVDYALFGIQTRSQEAHICYKMGFSFSNQGASTVQTNDTLCC